jgi:WD40 repeat protein
LTARVWNLRAGAEISHIAVHPTASQIFDLGFSLDGKLAFAAADALYVWEVDTGRIVDVMATSEVACASFNPDAKQILAASLGEEIWDIASGKLMRQLTKDHLWCARFSPDGTHIVSAPAYSEYARILDAKTGAVIVPLHGHTHFVTNVEYSPDGRLILTRSEDSTARLWDATTGRRLRVFTDVGGLFAAHFTPDGKQVLTESGGAAFSKLKGDETEPWRGRLWPVFADVTAMLERAKAMLPRCLTRDQRLAAFLDAEPPAWCIDMEKWPYATQDWKDWLKYKRAGANRPLPDSVK